MQRAFASRRILKPKNQIAVDTFFGSRGMVDSWRLMEIIIYWKVYWCDSLAMRSTRIP